MVQGKRVVFGGEEVVDGQIGTVVLPPINELPGIFGLTRGVIAL